MPHYWLTFANGQKKKLKDNDIVLNQSKSISRWWKRKQLENKIIQTFGTSFGPKTRWSTVSAT